MWHLYYRIHDLVSIKIIGSRRFDIDKNLRFSFFETDELDNPNIILRIGKFKPSNQGCHIVSHKYYVKENYLYCQDSDNGARWAVEIFGFENGNTEINFFGKGVGVRSNLLLNYWAQDIIRPIIEYKLIAQNYFLLHGGAVTTDSKAFMFSGRAGVFKTTLMMDFIRKANFMFLGDERVIISSGKILCFPISPVMFDVALKHSRTEVLSFTNELRIVKKIFFNENQQTSPTIDSAKLKAIFIIQRKDIAHINIVEMSLSEAITKLVANNKLEMTLPSPIAPSSHFLHYMMAYSLVFPSSRIASYWEELRIGLEVALKDVPIYLLEIPTQYDMNVFEKVLSLTVKYG